MIPYGKWHPIALWWDSHEELYRPLPFCLLQYLTTSVCPWPSTSLVVPCSWDHSPFQKYTLNILLSSKQYMCPNSSSLQLLTLCIMVLPRCPLQYCHKCVRAEDANRNCQNIEALKDIHKFYKLMSESQTCHPTNSVKSNSQCFNREWWNRKLKAKKLSSVIIIQYIRCLSRPALVVFYCVTLPLQPPCHAPVPTSTYVDCPSATLSTRLSDNVRNCQSYSNFLSKLKTHYFNTAFYNHIIC